MIGDRLNYVAHRTERSVRFFAFLALKAYDKHNMAEAKRLARFTERKAEVAGKLRQLAADL